MLRQTVAATMPSVRSLFFLSFALCACMDVGIADRNAVRQRDGTIATTTPAASLSPTQTGIQSESSSKDGETTLESSLRGKVTIVSSTAGSTSRTSSSTAPASASSTDGALSFSSGIYNATLTPDTLPIDPEITPSFAVSGVLLMLSGAVYALIGIKNKMLHIFLSACYLANLSVTVLVLYVMSPPVNIAIQGAYLVAITMTGLILGGAAIVFQEMTEGLGSLVGGFCLSMWLLVLKPGGLLTTTSSIAIFIACFSVASFATSFSHYTRPYGLIGGMSFGGATIIVLGIDCFSRAGLKEFWAYIWNLNQNLFPLGTTTYPLTRGMKVEIAAIIVITLAGIVSQSRLWRLINERRAQRAVARLAHEHSLQQEEEGVGRRIEHTNAQERGQWEAVYGEMDPNGASFDSGVGDMGTPTKKGARSIIVTQPGDQEVEMVKIPNGHAMNGVGLAMNSSQERGVTVRVVADDEPVPGFSGNGESLNDGKTNTRRLSQNSIQISRRGSLGEAQLVGAKVNEIPGVRSERDSKRKSGSPEIIPLPFQIPNNGVAGSNRSSVATFADEDSGHRRSKNFSGGSALLRRISARSLQRNGLSSSTSISTEELVVPHEDCDRSSLAATVDDLTDDEVCSLPNGSPCPSTMADTFDTPARKNSVATEEQGNQHLIPPSTPVAVDGIQDLVGSITSGTRQNQEITMAKSMKSKSGNVPYPPELAPVGTEEAINLHTRNPEDAADAASPVTTSIDAVPTGMIRGMLPSAVSKVVMSYRTNEWAKHLSSAETPELEDLKLSRYVPESTDQKKEDSAPVNVVELQQTAENGQVPPTSPTASQVSKQVSPMNSTNSLLYMQASSRSASRQSLKGQSHPPQVSNARFHRSSSSPAIGPTLVESPVEDVPIAADPIQANTLYIAPAAQHFSTSTLIGKRDTMIRSKSTLGNFAPMPSSTTEADTLYSTSEAESGSGAAYDARLDDDNMSLSARRGIIRQSSMPQYHSLSGSPSTLALSRRQSSTSVLHPAVRESQLASWRASVAHDLHGERAKGAEKSIEHSRSTLLAERKAEKGRRKEESARKGLRDSVFDERMRRGDMLEAHRNAMRKMQGKANKAL